MLASAPMAASAKATSSGKHRVLSLLASFLFLSSLLISTTNAQVTLYNTPGQAALGTAGGTPSVTAAEPDYTGLGAYDPLVLVPPPVPEPPPPREFPIMLMPEAAAQPGLSIPLRGDVLGFSIEMSVVDQVMGRNSSYINVPFLNLLGTLAKRSGNVQIRIGGNSQETAVLVDVIEDGRSIEKDQSRSYNPTETPPLVYTSEIIYMMGNISAMLPVDWFIGIPLNDSTIRIGIAEVSQQVLGDRLVGMQIGNEPDLYARHGARPETYSPLDFDAEFTAVADALANNPLTPMRNLLVGPSICTGDWTPDMMWDIGFIERHPELKIVSVERYPMDNCFRRFGVGTPREPQDMFPVYLNHTAGQTLAGFYLDSSRRAHEAGKPMYMFETNTASCGGFPGISDSFGAAIWMLDYGMQLAYANFSGVLLHVGGQNVNYNPFTPPPTRLSNFRRWTVGPVFYSALVMAEALGTTGTAQVVDLFANEGNVYTPAYAIYDNGIPARVLITNFVNDPSGASTITVNIQVGGGETFTPPSSPGRVWVKYLLAQSVAQKGDFTWAGMTFGSTFASDGRLMGEERIDEFPCDAFTNTCSVTVPAPGAALVFFSEPAVRESEVSASLTFATTAVTKLQNTATVAEEVLATSNGHSGKDRLSAEGERMWGSTSRGSASGAVGRTEGGLVGLVKEVVGKAGVLGGALGAALGVWGIMVVGW